MSRLTGIMPKLLGMLTPETLARIDSDPMLSVTRYDVGKGKLCIANASKALHSPTEIHQMFAKGIVYKIEDGRYTLVSLPFVKFYNSFEGVAVEDMKEIAQMENLKRIVYRKYDGTLISRFVLDGKVYFATRGRIINLEDNEFWKLVLEVIAKKDYASLLDPKVFKTGTAVFELIGPSNVIVEFHPEDDLVMTGYTEVDPHGEGTYSEVIEETLECESWMKLVFDGPPFYEKRPELKLPPLAEIYDTNLEPDELVKSWEDVREGIIVTFTDGDEIVYRLKIKQEAYLNLVRAKNKASKENLVEMIIENRFKTWQEVEDHLTVYLSGSSFFEELLNFYKEEWPTAIAKVETVRQQASVVAEVAAIAGKEPTRKEQFFRAKSLLNDDDRVAGLVMGMLSGKYDIDKLVEIMFTVTKK